VERNLNRQDAKCAKEEKGYGSGLLKIVGHTLDAVFDKDGIEVDQET
jgi:hypothetical protein